MIQFFRDVLDGPLYIVIVILCVIFLMAIFGFIMERKKFEREEKSKIAVISNPSTIPSEEVNEIKSTNAATAEVSNFIDFDSTSSTTTQEISNEPQVLELSSTPENLENPVPELVLNSEPEKK